MNGPGTSLPNYLLDTYLDLATPILLSPPRNLRLAPARFTSLPVSLMTSPPVQHNVRLGPATNKGGGMIWDWTEEDVRLFIRYALRTAGLGCKVSVCENHSQFVNLLHKTCSVAQQMKKKVYRHCIFSWTKIGRSVTAGCGVIVIGPLFD